MAPRKIKKCAYLHLGGLYGPVCLCEDRIHIERSGKSIFINPEIACKNCLLRKKKFHYGKQAFYDETWYIQGG
jgi:hypothetical protein